MSRLAGLLTPRRSGLAPLERENRGSHRQFGEAASLCMYDLVIVGGGPGGVAAGVYAARKKLNTVVVAENFGGQSAVSADIQNWIGTKSVSGFDLAKNLEEHLRAQQDLEIVDGDLVTKVEKADGGFKVSTRGGKLLDTKTILVASGSRHRRLGVPGEDRLDGKGVVWCSTCDAPLFGGKTVAVVGAGNAGLEAVRDSLAYASKVYLIVRGEVIKGDPQTLEEIKKDSRLEIMYLAETQEILGDKFVTGLKYLDKKDNQVKELKVDGVFVEIGAVPNVEFLGDLVKKDQYNAIIVDHTTQQTSQLGIWAAGDVTSLLYRQNNISAGDAVKAVLNINDYLSKINRS
ncbi:MAG: FAD-dependent oxidoreductase [Candidatus Harrisonbacteria bacterium]|nr:FAD-dependent oxidoreductase [Candidatus Harrisonbacteria bacterium]